MRTRAQGEDDNGGQNDVGDGLNCIAAVIENRAKEVGVAIFEGTGIKLTLIQFIETSRSGPNTGEAPHRRFMTEAGN